MEKYDSTVEMFMSNMRTNECTEATLSTYSNIFKLYRNFLTENGYEDASAVATLKWKESMNVSFRTMDMYLRILKYLSDFGVDTCIYSAPFVVEKMFPPKKQVSKEKNKEYNHVLTKEDAIALIGAQRYTIIGKRTPRTFLRDKAIVTTFLTSGMRNIELRNLTLKNLNYENGTIYCEITKGGKPRYVPFTEEAQKAVNDYLNSGLRPSEVAFDAPLFGVVTRDGEWRGIERTELSGIVYGYVSGVLGDEKASRSHALRHCFASVTLTNGTSMEAISAMLGHAEMATTRIYSKDLNPELTASNFAKNVSSMFKKDEVA
jgi:integrase/recombinase XerD